MGRHGPHDTLDGCLRRCTAVGSMLPFPSASSAHLTWAESRLQTNWPQEQGAGEAELTCRLGWKSGVGLRTASPPGPRRKLLPVTGCAAVVKLLPNFIWPCAWQNYGAFEDKKPNQKRASEGLGVAKMARCPPAFTGPL